MRISWRTARSSADTPSFTRRLRFSMRSELGTGLHLPHVGEEIPERACGGGRSGAGFFLLRSGKRFEQGADRGSVLHIGLLMHGEELQGALVADSVASLQAFDLRGGDLRYLALVGVKRAEAFVE